MTSHRSRSGRYHDWQKIVASLQAQPGVWAIRLPDQPARLVRTVRDRAAPQLHIEGGRIEAKLVNAYVNTRGRRRGDVYLRYTPDQGKLPVEHPPSEE